VRLCEVAEILNVSNIKKWKERSRWTGGTMRDNVGRNGKSRSSHLPTFPPRLDVPKLIYSIHHRWYHFFIITMDEILNLPAGDSSVTLSISREQLLWSWETRQSALFDLESKSFTIALKNCIEIRYRLDVGIQAILDSISDANQSIHDPWQTPALVKYLDYIELQKVVSRVMRIKRTLVDCDSKFRMYLRRRLSRTSVLR
jgi:hypothetical protein